MRRYTTGLVITGLFAILTVFFAPTISMADYRIYEYYEGLPSDYNKKGGWEGYNYHSSNVTADANASVNYSLGAPDIEIKNDKTSITTTYTCVGWKNAIGFDSTVQAAGTARSIRFKLNSDIAITWIYKVAHKLQVLSGASDNTAWGVGQNNAGEIGVSPSNNVTSFTENITLGGLRGTNDFTVLSLGVYNHGAAITADGFLYTWGNTMGTNGTRYNKLGVYNQKEVSGAHAPVRVFENNLFIDVAASNDTTAVIQNDGSLWTFGRNDVGQLGVNNNRAMEKDNDRVPVGNDLDWRSVTGGMNYFMAIKNNGTLWSWGEEDSGRLGFNSSANYTPSPTQVGTDRWRLAVAGFRHSAGIKEDGTLWLWGLNKSWQIGDYSKTNALTPKQVMIGSKWQAVAVGRAHTLAIREDGTLWAWGENTNSQLGNGNYDSIDYPIQIGTDKNWRSVAAGDTVSLAIKTDGTLWGWGKGPLGKASADINDLELKNEISTVAITTPHKIMIQDKNGRVDNWLKVVAGVYTNTDTQTYQRIMAIRSTNRVEATPHLGTRVLPFGNNYTISARAVPTNGAAHYYLTN